MADKRLNIDLTATDQASGKIDKVASKADALDRNPVDVDVTADITQASSALDGLRGQISEFDGSIGSLGGLFDKIASPQGAVAGLVGGLVAAGEYASDLAVEADNLANLTGDSVENASRLNAVWKQSGADAKDLQDVLLQMGGVLTTNVGLTKQLGVNLEDGKSLGERFTQVVDLVGKKFDDTAQRSVVMSQLFGEEGVRQVNAVISQVDDLGKAIDDVPDAAVVDDADVAQARAYKNQLKEFKVEMQAFAQALGEEVIPLMTALFGLATDIKNVLGDTGDLFNKSFFGGDTISNAELFGEVLAKDLGVSARLSAELAGGLVGGFAAAEAATDSVVDAVGRHVDAVGRQIEVTKRYSDADRAARDGAMEGLAEWNAAARESFELHEAGLAAGAEAAAEYADRINSSYQDAADSAMSFSDEAKSSLQAYIDELAVSTVKNQAFFDHLVAIGRQTSPEFVAHLASMGVGALDMVAEMRATEGGVQEAFGLWTQAAEVAGQDLSAELGAAGTAGSKAFRAALGNEHKTAVGMAFKNGKELGEQQMTGFAAGIDAKKAYAIAQARAAATEINNAMRSALGVPEGAQ